MHRKEGFQEKHFHIQTEVNLTLSDSIFYDKI